LTGTVQKSPAKGQPIEFVVSDYKCLGTIKDPEKYFMGQRGFVSRGILRQVPHQRHHTQLFLALQILKQLSYKSLHESFGKLKIGEIQPTLITGNECEDGAHPFTVTTLLDEKFKDTPVLDDGSIDWSKDFFEKRCYLTVSSQLHLEATVLGTKRDGYCMTTAFRAEPSTGPLHLAEFLMPEWELIGGGLMRNMAVAQTVLKYVFTQVLEHCMEELEYLEDYRKKDDKAWYDAELAKIKDKKKLIKTKELSKKEWAQLKKDATAEYERKQGLPSIIDRLTRYRDVPFAVTTHEECVRQMLEHQEAGKVVFEEQPGYGEDFSKQHEFYITEVLFGGRPTFVRYYPKPIKAFYMPIVDEKSETGVEHVDCYDLLFPYVGEVVGGSQRIADEGELVKRMEELGMSTQELDWYLDLRRDASLPHGGAGLGFGRMMIAMSGIHNIKDMQEFPRACRMACYA